MKIRDKIALNFVLVTAVTLLLLSVFVYLFFVSSTHAFFYTRLKVRASIALQVYLDKGKADVMLELRERHLQFLPEEEEVVVLYDSSNDRWNRDMLPIGSKEFYKEAQLTGYAEYDDDFTHYVAVNDKRFPGVMIVAKAYDEEGKNQTNALMNLLLVGFVLSGVFVFILGRVLAFQIIKPVSDIINEVNHINASNLDRRLSTAKGTDEIAALAQTFNHLLDRLHVAFQLQSNFIANASHEFRTPLTTILGESDLALSVERQKEDYKNSIKVITAEAEKLNGLVNSLLELSQVGFDGKRQMLEPVNIDLLMMKIKSQINQRYPVNHVKIELKDIPDNPDALVLTCIPSWIELAFLNIITNAIKYSDNKDDVEVGLSANENHLIISIKDVGIGIEETDMKHVFELFFRGSNSQSYTGHGIGLPLADKIIRLHGGTISIVSKPQLGTTVTVKFDRRIKKG